MTSYQSTVSLSTEPDNIDLVRRYCPSLDYETSEALAALIRSTHKTCWPWPGALTSQGYGYFAGEPTPYGAPTTISTHRYMYEVFVGDLPMEHHIHHTCLTRACWHPGHLEDVTPQEHSARHRIRPYLPPTPWRPMVQLVFPFAC